MKYKSISVTARGGPENLTIVENELRRTLPGEVRVRIEAVPVCQDDIAARRGNRPFLPKLPFTPGYSILGIVDDIGKGVTDVYLGDRVAALTRLGGYSEYVYLPSPKVVPVPAGLDSAEASVLILNYLVAYQVMHRVAKVKPNDKVLIIGASGGVGTAFLHLGKLAGLKMYGLASLEKHAKLIESSAIPIDYKTQDFVEVFRKSEPEGLDFVFNGMGGEYVDRGMKILRRGGMFIHYGGPESVSSFLRLLIKLGLYTLFPLGKTMKGYGTHRINPETLKQDWQQLFKLLGEGKIKPVIAHKFSILQAAEANKLLEAGSIIGNVVLMAPELLKKNGIKAIE